MGPPSSPKVCKTNFAHSGGAPHPLRSNGADNSHDLGTTALNGGVIIQLVLELSGEHTTSFEVVLWAWYKFKSCGRHTISFEVVWWVYYHFCSVLVSILSVLNGLVSKLLLRSCVLSILPLFEVFGKPTITFEWFGKHSTCLLFCVCVENRNLICIFQNCVFNFIQFSDTSSSVTFCLPIQIIDTSSTYFVVIWWAYYLFLNGAAIMLLVLDLCSEHITTFLSGFVSILSVPVLCCEPKTYFWVALWAF